MGEGDEGNKKIDILANTTGIGSFGHFVFVFFCLFQMQPHMSICQRSDAYIHFLLHSFLLSSSFHLSFCVSLSLSLSLPNVRCCFLLAGSNKLCKYGNQQIRKHCIFVAEMQTKTMENSGSSQLVRIPRDLCRPGVEILA